MPCFFGHFFDLVQEHSFAYAPQAEQHLRPTWLAKQGPLNGNLRIVEY